MSRCQTHLRDRVGNNNDELYTQYKTVEVELRHHNFSGMRVYCPCDGGWTTCGWTTGYIGRLNGEYSKYISSCGGLVSVPSCYLTNMNVKYYLIKLPDYVKDDNIQYLDGTVIVNVNKLKNINWGADYLQAVPVTILCHRQSGRFSVVRIFKPYINGKKSFYRVVIKVNK